MTSVPGSRIVRNATSIASLALDCNDGFVFQVNNVNRSYLLQSYKLPLCNSSKPALCV
ncbi:hypothetical protein AAHB49_21410 [Bacillus cereus]